MARQPRNVGGPRTYVVDAVADLAAIIDPKVGEDALVLADGSVWFHTGTVWQQTAGGSGGVAATLSGNTAGVLAAISSGTLTLAGGNNITLSQAGNAVTISGANVGGGAFSAGVSTAGNTQGDTGLTGSQIVFVGSNNMTISQATDANGATLSFKPQFGIRALGVSNTGNTLGNTGSSNNVSWILAASGAITASQSTQAGNIETIWLSVAPQSVQAETQTFLGGLKNTETTYTSGTVELEGTNNITVFSTTGQRFRISGANTHAIQTAISGLANSETTYTSGTVSLSAMGNLTIRSTTGNQFQLSVAAQTVQAETQTFVGGIANSETTYTSGTVKLSELGAITVRSTTGNQYQLSVNAQTTQTQNLIDVTLSGNTSGALALVSSGTLTLAGGNNITLSQAGNAVTISGANAGGAQTAISGLANSETTYTSGSVTLSALGAITIRSTTGQHFQFSVDSQTVPTVNIFYNMALATGNVGPGTQNFTAFHKSVLVFPLGVGGADQIFPGNMTINTFLMPLSLSGSTATMSAAYTSIFRIGLYTLRTDLTALALDNSVGITVQQGAAATNNSTQLAGLRWLTAHSSEWSKTPMLTPGNWWVATHWSSAGILNQTGQILGQNFAASNSTFSGTIGSQSSSGTSLGWFPFLGGYSATSNALPGSIASNALSKPGTDWLRVVPMIVLNQNGPATF